MTWLTNPHRFGGAVLAFHALDDVGGSFTADVIIGTGSLTAASTGTARYYQDDIDIFATHLATEPGEMYANAEWWVVAQAGLTNVIDYSRDLTNAAWTVLNGPVVAFNQVGLGGVANSASHLQDDNGGGFEYVVQDHAVTANTNPSTGRFWIKKTSGATIHAGVGLQSLNGTNTFGNFTLDTDTGALTARSSNTGSVSAQSRDAGLWWEVLVEAVNPGDVTSFRIQVLPAVESGTPSGAWSATHQNTITVGNVEFIEGKGAEEVRIASPLVSDSTTDLTISETGLSFDDANHDDDSGGYYIEWRPSFATADVSGDIEILSLNSAAGLLFYDATNSLLKSTDGTNTASVALTVVKHTTYKLWVAYGGSSLQVGYDSSEGAVTSYDGAFQAGTELELCTPAAYTQLVRNLRRYAGTFAQCKAAVAALASA